ncbi:hypothetical protein [Phenylobacterium sp.]|uniref:hypothetical protein n=1 Tax=Phenylobacterium sp. TaxID=1871053 RepID=UPI002731DCDF|nr:hypothetical protein [Phenylobacterium sp.]MDP1619332.1 hypothetical protein [Phenylobacterium sp.]MDP1985723.1 hypothetical protein [Phenylobacterium sp.]
MRLRTILPIFAALGLTLGLAACDERPPKPAFTEKSASKAGTDGAGTETAQASADTAAPTLPPAQTAANCCACPPAKTPACPEAKPVRTAKAPAKPAARSRPAPTRQARATPAPRKPAPPPREYAHRGPAPLQGEGYRRYQGPDIATRGGYEHRQEQYAGGFHDQRQGQYRQEYREQRQGQRQEQYREHRQEQYQARRHEEQRYAYAPPPPPPPPPYVSGRVEQYDAYSEHRSYSQQSSGYVQGAAAGPCCGGPRVEAAGRDAGGYLTWPGKRAPAPYY